MFRYGHGDGAIPDARRFAQLAGILNGRPPEHTLPKNKLHFGVATVILPQPEFRTRILAKGYRNLESTTWEGEETNLEEPKKMKVACPRKKKWFVIVLLKENYAVGVKE